MMGRPRPTPVTRREILVVELGDLDRLAVLVDPEVVLREPVDEAASGVVDRRGHVDQLDAGAEDAVPSVGLPGLRGALLRWRGRLGAPRGFPRGDAGGGLSARTAATPGRPGSRGGGRRVSPVAHDSQQWVSPVRPGLVPDRRGRRSRRALWFRGRLSPSVRGSPRQRAKLPDLHRSRREDLPDLPMLRRARAGDGPSSCYALHYGSDRSPLSGR